MRRQRLAQDLLRELRAWIDAELGPGAKLPSEVALAQRFEVSRATLREALAELAVEGSVVRRWGVGTFVAEGPVSTPLDYGEIVPLREAIRATGHEPQLGRAVIDRVRADEVIGGVLALPEGSEIWAVERLFTVDGKPAVLLRDWMPVVVRGATVDPEPLRELDGDLLGLLRSQARTKVVRMHTRVDAVTAEDDLAELLQTSAGQPLVETIQSSYDDTGAVVVFSRSYYRADVVALTFVRTPGGARTGTSPGVLLGSAAAGQPANTQ